MEHELPAGGRPETTVIHIIGSPGVGKFTIASEVARRTGARLVDNHSIANVIFNTLAPDGVTPLPPSIWPFVGRVRAAVLDTIASVSPPHLSFVFTNFIRGEDEGEYGAFLEVVAVAEARGSLFVPVLLTCRTDELVRRIVTDDRRARMKLVDPVQGARLNDEVPPFATGHPNTLALDVSDRSPGDAAQEILDWVERCRGGDIEQWGAARIPAADADVGALYRQLTDYWNGRDAAAYGALFAEGGSIVGFDGSQVDGRDAIASHLAEIFANHPTPAYVVKVLEVRPLGPGAMLLRAAAGLLPPGASDLHPDLNSIQTLVATRHWGGWRVEMFQSTPAAFHGRPDLAERLTAELTEVLRGR